MILLNLVNGLKGLLHIMEEQPIQPDKNEYLTMLANITDKCKIIKFFKMKNITNELSEEHQTILKVIDIVLNECNQLEKNKEPDKAFFNEVINFIKKYADGYHHAKEEDILFKAMLDNIENMHCNPIPVMLHEHDAGRQFVKGMIEALSAGNKQELIENARGYCFLLQSHIYKEDNILYPMAEQVLDESQKQRVEELFNAVKAEEFFDINIQAFIDKLSQVNSI
jgi:hemerythrin-like domain-containing protein